MDRYDQDYFLEDGMQTYYQSIQAITGSQIIRAYGVPPIQEAPSNEEITLRHIDSHLSNFGRSENRHMSQGFSNMSNVLTPKLQGHRTVNDLNSIVILPNKKDQIVNASNMQTSLQLIVQQNQSFQQLPINGTQPKPSSNKQIERQGSGFSAQNKVNLTEDDQTDQKQQDSYRQKAQVASQQLQQKQNQQLYQQTQTLQSQNNNDKVNQNNPSTLDVLQGGQMQGSLLESSNNLLKEQQQNQNNDNQDNSQKQVNYMQYQNYINQNQTAQTEVVFENKSVSITCPKCLKNIETKVNYTPSCKTHLVGVGLGLFGFICGLCLIPYYFQDKFQTAIHYCPLCDKELGRCEY
ncbi:hypothetical protein ABPG72_000180 [Tetrahymena utriculariae]